jgi:phage terminase small subunit
MALTPKQRLFVEEYLVDLNATQAAIRAGYSKRTAEKIGSENLSKPEIMIAVAEAQQARFARIHMSQDDVLETLAAWASADPRELVEHRRVCCRYCHSPNGLRQEKPSERHARKAKHDEMLRQVPESKWHLLPPWDDLGGVGYDPRKEPNPECLDCFGLGEEQVVVKDTRKLSKGAAMLYGGVKTTRDGLEVKMQPKDKAVELLARHYRLLGAPGDGDGDGPRKVLIVNDPDDL